VALVVAFVLGVDGIQLLAPLLGIEAAVSLLAPPPLVVLGAGIMAAVGLLDDLLDLGYRTKFAAQALVTLLVMMSGLRVSLFDGLLDGGWDAWALSGLLTLVWVVGAMNAVNLIDGKDGLAGGATALAFLGMAGAHALNGDAGGLLLVAAVLGALVGFLRYNVHPASIFMGDSGSLFLGYLLAAYGLRGTAHADPALALIIPAVAMGLPVLDTLVSMGRRFLHRRPLFFPDRDHIHHRVSARLPYGQAVLALWGLAAFFAAGAMLMAAVPARVSALVFTAGAACVAALLGRLGYLRRDAPVAVPAGAESGDGVAEGAPPEVARPAALTAAP
jgi:UDP-GlcNAc:undecaprenyl-phosphate GlcNAc-1-phosphate transferase